MFNPPLIIPFTKFTIVVGKSTVIDINSWLNISSTFAFADGLSHSLYTEIMAALDEEQKAKIVSAENVDEYIDPANTVY